MDFISSITALGTTTLLSIIAISIAYILISIVIQRKLSNAKRMRQIQLQLRQIQKELGELIKAKAPQPELQAKQSQMMALTTQSMTASFKPLVVLFPLTMIFYYWIVPHLHFATTSNIGTIQTLFVILLVVGGLIASLIIGQYDKAKAKKEAVVRPGNITLEINK